jgi:acetyltransferase-like isoleucine patch superfamily enzyme
VHGGPTPFENFTIAGNDVWLGASSVLFRSRVGDGTRIGRQSLVQLSDLPMGARVLPRTVMIENRVVGRVEW